MRGAGRFLIVTWEGGGNVPPVVALGYQLSRAGDDVRLLGRRSAAGEVSAAGLRFVPYASVPAWPGRCRPGGRLWSARHAPQR